MSTNLCEMVAGYDEKQAREMFKAADADGSGLIELPEFLAWFRAEARRLKNNGKLLAADTPRTPHGQHSNRLDELAGLQSSRSQLHIADDLASARLMREVPGTPTVQGRHSRMSRSSIDSMKRRASQYGSGT